MEAIKDAISVAWKVKFRIDETYKSEKQGGEKGGIDEEGGEFIASSISPQLPVEITEKMDNPPYLPCHSLITLS